MENLSESLTLTIPISADAYLLAQKFSNYHSNPLKGKQVYFNTLAISVVKVYLRYMGIETNWEDCLSYNPLTQTLLNIADLDVKGLGKLECRPIEIIDEAKNIADDIIRVPLEVCLDRIGYVFIQINELLKTAKILGFSKTIPENGELYISELQSLENLLFILSQPVKVETQSVVSIPQTTNLGQWFKNVFEIGWQTVESLLSLQQQAEIAFRGKVFETIDDNSQLDSQYRNSNISIERGKVFDLGQKLKYEQIILIVELIPTCEEQIDIWVKICPLGAIKNLPEELQLFVLDELGTAVMQATARSAENILLNFSSAFGEHFSVKLTLNDISFTEHFQV